MRSTLDELMGTLRELRIFVSSIDPTNSALRRHKDDAVRCSLTLRRRLDVVSFFISLYSALERFIEDIAWAHAETEARDTAAYSGLNERLRDTHLVESGRILTRRQAGKGLLQGVTEADVARNLFHCLSDSNPYQLNRHALIYHEQNFRSDIIKSLFTSLGVEGINGLVRRQSVMIDWHRRVGGREGDVPESSIMLRLDGLVERRNNAAHSGSILTEIISPSELFEHLDFVEAYCTALFAVLAGKYLARRYARSMTDATNLGRPVEGPFKQGYVVVLANPPCRLFTGQALFGARNGEVDRFGKLVELQVDGRTVVLVEAGLVGSVGIRADFALGKTLELFALENSDPVVWL